MTRSRVLIVEPEMLLRLELKRVAADFAITDADPGMSTARSRLLGAQHDWLITNIRLEEYNGLHLAYLAKMAGRPIRVLVYGDDADLVLAREARQLGAFYEPKSSIVNSLAGYLTANLPPSDRRDAALHDRRNLFRGGRRSSDFERVRVNLGQVGSTGGSHVRIFRDP